MNLDQIIPWERYGFIAELVNRLENVSPQLGKTALQKLVYLLQEIFGVDAGYDFKLYTYGPFTSQLLQDLDQVDALHGVNVELVESALGGYNISSGEKYREIRDRAKDYLNEKKVKGGIDKLITEFGHLWAKELELRATIVYAVKNNKDLYEQDDLVNMIHEIKPRFNKVFIGQVINELKAKNYITLKQ
ncbi:MAG: restriction endonuclease [Candidatus Latescibacteria bacterium]|nr:restriction endonuclease [Candidatus Latescibacterota bacterium]